MSATKLDSRTRAELVTAREAVWRAFFQGDSARLLVLLPQQMVGMGQNRAEIIRDSREFVRNGGKFIGITFTDDEFFVEGNAAVVFSRYDVRTTTNGKPSAITGRAIELFVKRDGRWINPSWHLDEERK